MLSTLFIGLQITRQRCTGGKHASHRTGISFLTGEYFQNDDLSAANEEFHCTNAVVYVRAG